MAAYTSNQYCVEKLLVLSESHSIVATQDIFDEQGFKLLAKGASVSRSMQDRLLLRKLKAPLESSLAVHDGLTVGELLQGALDLIEQIPALECVAGGRGAREILREARNLHIPPPLLMLMTCARHADPESYRRTQIVAAICAGVGAQLNAPVSDVQTVLVASALHDLGEIYINPEFVHPQRHLSPREWKHVATHPHVGQILIRNLTSLPPAVIACVGQHHERHDGSGYPAQLVRQEQHALSGWIAAADSAAALISRGDACGDRVSLALRIVPEEYDKGVADALIRSLYALKTKPQSHHGVASVAQAQSLLERLDATGEALNMVSADGGGEALKDVCSKALELLNGFAKSLRATGILDAGVLSGEDIEDQGLLEEMHNIVSEVKWRMRNLARNIYMSVEACEVKALAQFQRVIELLDAAPASEAGRGG